MPRNREVVPQQEAAVGLAGGWQIWLHRGIEGE